MIYGMRKIKPKGNFVCVHCSEMKPHTVRKDGSPYWKCIDCHSKYNSAHYLRTKEKYKKTRNDSKRRIIAEIKRLQFALKKDPCLDCGVSYPPYVMQFDHREPSEKKFQISSKMYNPESISIEASKCDVVCANCHMERTHGKKFRERYGSGETSRTSMVRVKAENPTN